MTTELTTSEGAALVLIPDPGVAGKDGRYRLGKYATWLDASGADWWVPDLATYRDYLLNSGGSKGDPLSPATTSAHLSTVRARYRSLVRDRPIFFALVPDDVVDGVNFGSKKEAVDETIKRIENGIDPNASPVTTETVQDAPDSDHLRLTATQAGALLASPDLNDLKGLRDCAVIAVLLCTGIREQELSNLIVNDLRQTFAGELALQVRKGKGCKSRLVVYGELSWCLAIVDKWLERAGISEGPVFRGLYKGGRKLRPGQLSVRAIEYILASYPIMVDGVIRTVKPHDCRRTYAKRLNRQMSTNAIRENLGHADIKTTLAYIGPEDARDRRPSAIYSFDLTLLNSV